MSLATSAVRCSQDFPGASPPHWLAPCCPTAPSSALTTLADGLLHPVPEPFECRVDDRFLRPPLQHPDHRYRQPDSELVRHLSRVSGLVQPVSTGQFRYGRAAFRQLPAHLLVTLPGVREHVAVLDHPGVEGEPDPLSETVVPGLEHLG